MMSIFIGVIIWGIIWGFATNAVVRNKGYSESWFLWGFFFGIIAFIVALTKPENKSQSSYNSYSSYGSDTSSFDSDPYDYRNKISNSGSSLFGVNNSQEILKQDGWRCTCGRMNYAYIGTCACGRSKNEVLTSQTQAEKQVEESKTASAIREYKKLLDDGIITSEEFEAKKKDLLGL